MTERRWVTAWAASAQGPYPVGNTLLQPHQSLAFPFPDRGACNQTFRLIIRPSIWGDGVRIRLSNVFGVQPVTFVDVFIGMRLGGAAVIAGTNRPITFGARDSIMVEPGSFVWSDPLDLDFDNPALETPLGRELAVSFAILGESGPMTWHAKALSTSYVTKPREGSRGAALDESAFPFTTSSWFFLDVLDMAMGEESFAIVALGDSTTEGTGSTFAGADRWTDILARLITAQGVPHISIVNAGIGGNQIAGPQRYDATHPFAGGPSALSRLDRDVLGLSSIAAMIWLQGINDFSRNGARQFDEVRAAMVEGVAYLRRQQPNLLIIGGTVISALGSSNPAHGFAEEDAERRTLNGFIRTSGLFDAVIDFDEATVDKTSGRLRAEFVPSSVEGPGDGLHPNRAGYLSMARAAQKVLRGLLHVGT